MLAEFGYSLSSLPLLADLPRAAVARLEASARRQWYRRGETIFRQGDPGDTLNFIESGVAKVIMPGAGDVGLVVDLLGPGECFGECDLFADEGRFSTVEAFTYVQVVALARCAYLEATRAHPLALERLLAMTSSRLRRAHELAADLTHLDLPGRVAKVLLRLAQAYGDADKGTAIIDLPITQRDLAAMVGGSRESINKVIGWYEHLGALQRAGHQITVLRPELLSRRVTLGFRPAAAPRHQRVAEAI